MIIMRECNPDLLEWNICQYEGLLKLYRLSLSYVARKIPHALQTNLWNMNRVIPKTVWESELS